MRLKMLHFPIFIAVFLLFISCKKEEFSKTDPVNIKYYAIIDQAENHLNKNQLDSAFFYYNKAKNECYPNDSDRKVYALNNMAKIQKMVCDFTGSENSSTEALKICSKPVYLTSIYNNLGLCYQEQLDFDNAIKNYKLSLEQVKTKIDRQIIENNISLVYLDQKEYLKASKILEPLIKDDTLKKNEQEYARVLDNLGFTYQKLKNPLAIKHLTQALNIRERLKNSEDLIASYIHLSEYYQKEKTALSVEYAKKAYTVSNNINSPDDRIEALRLLVFNTNTATSREYAIQQIAITDSITKIRQIAKNQFAKIKYDSKKALQEAERFNIQRQIYLLLFIAVSLFSMLLYYIIQFKNKQKLQEVAYTTETRISKKLHDELANDVFNTLTFAETQDLQNDDKKETLLDNLDKIYSRTRNISKENSEIDTKENYENNLKEMLSSYSNSSTNVIISKNNIKWSEVNKESKIAIHRVLQELMVNMKKHSQSSLVVIAFENDKKALEINYSDNGKGCPEMLNLKKGLQNAENRILAIKGTLTFETETNKGFKVKMKIPK